ncbi:translocation/assembly module TamB domain-containing protein [Longitalea arenae]|uniref:translocation/assembly module TamB domain-containing protein n=1 Tax=Longitalea arenae TaxID=2812558 RepID=UPI00196898C5
MLLVLIGLIILAWLAIQTSFVQNWLVKQITGKLSKNLHATVRIKHVDFALFNKMVLEGTLVNDQHKDTLLYAGAVKVNLTDWFFLKDRIVLNYIGLEDALIHLQRSDSTWNYRFLADYFSSPKKKEVKKQDDIDLDLEKVEFRNVKLIQTDGWRGEDMTLQLGSMDVDADEINLKKRTAHINSITIHKPVFAIYNYDGNRPDSLRPKPDTAAIINDPKKLRWNPGNWDVAVDRLTLDKGTFRNDVQTDRLPYEYFDGNHILFTDIKAVFNKVVFKQDTVTAGLLLSTKERSGLVVKKLNARVTWHPEAMEFARLDIQTNRSHLQNYFAMRYATFDDMSDFEDKVRMEGDFTNAVLNSDDIAYFAPELQAWKKEIRVTGKVKGTIENLSARKLIIEAGKDTYLNGNIRLNSLTKLDKTYIDFEANEFRTTYRDAITIIPDLKGIEQPRLDKLEYLRFRGNFTGFIKDFVTYGTIETRLGVVVSDVNMKFPDNGPTIYTGSIETRSFALGEFVDAPQVGKINFTGSVNGRGLRASTLNAKLDGNIRSLDVNNYNYQNIVVKGTVAKRLFNGEVISNDPNLTARLNGLVDFSQKVPAFNFDAEVSKADLRNVKLTRDSIEVKGKFRMNFTGSNIDNFLGTARIYEASILKDSKPISFDSLSIESKAMGNNKVITVVSNEFDGALVGDFSIRDLPDAVRSFLNKYYPSYIKPSRRELKNENFSFVFTTKKVDEYMSFIDKNLGGFNYSTITGRINSKENVLDLNAEVPQFNYKNIFFYNLNLKGTGNYDSLSLSSTIADVYLNDSLHFPGTDLRVRSAKDMSLVQLKTAANQTLNSADLFARVQTMPGGVHITFNESNFDLNGKNWTIEKNGELVLSKELVSAEGVKIYNGQQEILVTTHPSDIGNTNDIKVELKKVNIGDFAPYVTTDNRLEGLLTATADIIDPFGKLQVDLAGEAEMFRLDNDSIGKLQLNANYSQVTNRVNFKTISANDKYIFDLNGLYNLSDTAHTAPLDITGNFKDTKIRLLDKYLSDVFTDLDGYATGQLRIVGPPNDLKYLGRMQLRDGELRVIYTNVLYKIPSAVFDFQEDQIDFGAFKFKDEKGNTGQITRGILRHRAFDDLYFDFAFNTNKLMVLNTGSSSKDPFFGTLIAKANATFKGPLEDMRLDVRGEPADSSKLNIRSQTGRESGQASFVVWKQYGSEMKAVRSTDASNLHVSLDVTANNFANMYVILDELTGDVIQANGHGNLKMNTGTDGNFSITGRYEIDRGNYNFNFQSLLRKPFKLKENTGNYIQWRGDPYDATIKIDAEYEADDVRFSDLATEAVTNANSNVRKYRGKVIVVASLTKSLMKPDIAFQIELPTNSPLKDDPDALRILQLIQRDQNELNKQVAFLIVFNSFGPVSSSSQNNIGSLAFSGVVVNSISGVLSGALSKQFSSIFQKLFNDKSIKVNFNAQLYNGSNLVDNIDRSKLNIDRTNLNFNIGKSFLNERLTFTFGSAVDFGLSPQQVQATKNLQFLPDISADWKIRQDGKLVLTFFYRDSYNYLAGTGARQNRSGASISYRRDFERLSDLWRADRKKKLKPPVVNNDTSRNETGSN